MKSSLQPLKTPKQKRSLQIFESLLQAAQELIESSPNTSESISAIAKKAGVGISSFYDYFSSKESLLHEILKREIEKNLQEFEAVLHHCPPDNPEVYSRQLSAHFFSHFFTKRNLIRSLAKRVFHSQSNELIFIGRKMVVEMLEKQLLKHFSPPAPEDLSQHLTILVNLYLDGVHRSLYLLERSLVSEEFCRKGLEALAVSQINLIFQKCPTPDESPTTSGD